MYQQINREALQLEHQLDIRSADQFGHHLPMSGFRLALVERRIVRAAAAARLVETTQNVSATTVFSFPSAAELLPR